MAAAGVEDNRSQQSATASFLTEADTGDQSATRRPTQDAVASPRRAGAGSALSSIYRVEDADPPEVLGDRELSAPLPSNIPVDKVMTNIVNNLDFGQWSAKARGTWFKDFRSPPSKAVVSDTFWYCICFYFKTGRHTDLEGRLFGRISANYVSLFSAVPAVRKDFFFDKYADAIAQAVLYTMFLAYPKSRVHFTEKFRQRLVTHISYWTTGIMPEFVDTKHWKLNLGGGDVLHSTTVATAEGPSLVAKVAEDAAAGSQTSLAHRAPRPVKTLRYSPLIEHFLKSKKYSSVNFIRPTRMSMTLAEERSRLMDVKHALLIDRAHQAKQCSDDLMAEYDELCTDLRRQERQRQLQARSAKEAITSSTQLYCRFGVHAMNMPGRDWHAAA